MIPSACGLVVALPSRAFGSMVASASCNASRSVAVVRTSPTFAPSSTRVRATLGEIPEMMQSHPMSRVACVIRIKLFATAVSTVTTPLISMTKTRARLSAIRDSVFSMMS